jgi:hypothetical protein
MAKKTHLKMRTKCTVVFLAIYFLTISAAAVVGYWILSWATTLEISARRRSDKSVKNL